MNFAKLIADQYGLTSWANAEPELHREIILCARTVEPGSRSSVSFDFIRALYSTWIVGPKTEGCGINQNLVLEKYPEASMQWKTTMVVLVDNRVMVTGGIRAGVIPASILEDQAWWAYADRPVSEDDPRTLAEALGLEQGVYKTKIRHDGVFYPEKKV